MYAVSPGQAPVMPPHPSSHSSQEYDQPANNSAEWKPFGQEFSIRASLENLTRELALQQIAFQNLDRDMQNQRREVVESLTCIQVDVNGTLSRFQRETRNEMQHLHDSLTNRIRNQDSHMKQLEEQYREQHERLDSFEMTCNKEHEKFRQSQNSILDQLKIMGQKIQEWRTACPVRPTVNFPEAPNHQQSPLEKVIPNTAKGARADCPYCHKNLSLGYLQKHIAKVCRNGNK
ncbi:unnamed protein product [Allacma fusca]|uniref:Uncharacterized protein n=1 Tax=Allacma fusca TaxID=39272 RepID=A0A8J2NR73_9HEXA|nr:unnamed protein product [Allacma fusca]